MLFGLVVTASRWLLRRALHPVAEMTQRGCGLERARARSPIRARRAARRAHSLAATLDGLLERLAPSLRREQRFSAEMSHELRTPLARIQAEVEFALAAERTPTEHREALEAIAERRADDENGGRPRSCGAPASSPYAAPPMREGDRRAVEATRATSSARGDRPRFETPRSDVRVAVDRDVVERIVAPFSRTPAGTELTEAAVTVIGQRAERPHHRQRRRPRRQPARAREHLPPRDAWRRPRSAGLGLALARRLARAAGGEITAQAGPGGRFAIRLPPA